MFRVSAQHFSYTAIEWYGICGFSWQIRQITIQPNPPPTLIACVLRKVSQVSQQGETQCENNYCPYVLISTHLFHPHSSGLDFFQILWFGF